MEHTPEQIKEIKKQLTEQINASFPEDKKSAAIKNIESMQDSQLIEFLKQNKLIKEGGGQNNQCIFCSLVFGDIPSTKIAENEKAIAILELNPISKGHSLIIPKEHISKPEDIPQEAKELAEQVSEKIAKTFNPKSISMVPGNITGHEILNVLPIYDNETINSPKQKQTPEGLAKLKEEIESSQTSTPEIVEASPKQEENINKENTWLPKRLP